MLKVRQRFGKYVIEGKLGEGGFAAVYRARDTIEGIRVALKIPFTHLLTEDAIDSFRREARLAARLDHPHILPLKYADHIEGRFVIVTALAEMTLQQRLQKRLAVTRGIDFAKQMLSAVAYAHENRVIHCDINPDNVLLFPGNQVRLADFGIARVAHKTLQGSGTGTVGYIAPEQAMGKPSFRSDVFSLGVVLYRMFSGVLPEWPYEWPLPGHARLRRRLDPKLIDVIRKAVEPDARRRYRDARQMLAAFNRVRRPLKSGSITSRRATKGSTTRRDWQMVRRREFQRQYGKQLETSYACTSCGGPVSESMQACPWCGKSRSVHAEGTRFPTQCPRCHRGLKSDWRYCPWCFGPGFDVPANRQYTDRRYVARCANPKCDRKDLMPFMRYCPWCRRKVRRRWLIEGIRHTCSGCGWGVLPVFWRYCPWCGKRVET